MPVKKITRTEKVEHTRVITTFQCSWPECGFTNDSEFAVIDHEWNHFNRNESEDWRAFYVNTQEEANFLCKTTNSKAVDFDLPGWYIKSDTDDRYGEHWWEYISLERYMATLKEELDIVQKKYNDACCAFSFQG
jgi:hypothetical protein